MSEVRSNKHLFQFLITISILLDVSAVFFNALIEFVLKQHRKTSIVTMWFIYCMSVSDVIVGVVQMVHYLALTLLFISSARTDLVSLDSFFLKLSGYLFST